MLTPPFRFKIFEWAYFPTFEISIRYLAETLADEEEWDFSDTARGKFSILKSYLDHTYRKLLQEKKIVYTSDNKYACFNTGLVTNNWEEIFAFFEQYNNVSGRSNPAPYIFKAFLKKSENQFLVNFSRNIPELANYFDRPELLIFNPKCDLIPDIDHIISDNIDRFPNHLRGADDAELRRHLMGSIDEVKKKVRTNYKIAIPQYYDGKIQLLLPLCLTAGSPNADLALVVNKVNETAYSARTCLTLKMAYNNARLIVKPQSNWLRP